MPKVVIPKRKRVRVVSLVEVTPNRISNTPLHLFVVPSYEIQKASSIYKMKSENSRKNEQIIDTLYKMSFLASLPLSYFTSVIVHVQVSRDYAHPVHCHNTR